MGNEKGEGRQSTVCISLMLAVEDAAKAAAWYVRALGAIELWSLGSVVGLQPDMTEGIAEASLSVCPSQSNILETEVTTAVRVAEFMFDQGLAQVERPRGTRAWLESQLYTPRY